MFKDTATQQCEELMNMTTLWNLTECHLLHLLLSEIVGHCSNRRSTHQLYRRFFWPKAIWTYQATNLSFHFADISRRNAPQRKGLTMARNAKAAASMSQMDKMGSMAKYTLTLTRRWSKDNIEKKTITRRKHGHGWHGHTSYSIFFNPVDPCSALAKSATSILLEMLSIPDLIEVSVGMSIPQQFTLRRLPGLFQVSTLV